MTAVALTKAENSKKEKVKNPKRGLREGETQAARGAEGREGAAAGDAADRGEVEEGSVEERVNGDVGDDQGQVGAVVVARGQDRGLAVAAAVAGVGASVVKMESMQVQEKAGVGVGPQESGELAARAASQGGGEEVGEREPAGADEENEDRESPRWTCGASGRYCWSRGE
jgi:hypothetical protein